MINQLKPKSEFSRSVLTLMTGTAIAQAIPMAISPILTRLYTPDDFGILALFIAITSIFGSIANGRYELAIMLPKKDEDAINILALGFIINIFLSIFLLLVIIIFHNNILNLLNNKEISPWLYLVPISVFLMGCFNSLNYFNNRKKFYKDLSKAKVYKSIGMTIVQLGSGLLKSGAIGLISGQMFSQIISNTKLFFNIKKLHLFKKITLIKIIALSKRYQKFPKFSMWATLFSNLSQNLLNLLITSFYNIKTLGFYSFTYRLLSIPLGLIGLSISQVFYEKVTHEKHQTGKAVKTFNMTLKKLIIISLPLFIILYFIVENLFAFIFGEEWKIAGTYARILMPLFLIRFIVSPLTLTAIAFEKLKIDLVFQVGLLFLYIIIFYLMKEKSFETMLKNTSVIIGVYYVLYLFFLRKIAMKGIE